MEFESGGLSAREQARVPIRGAAVHYHEHYYGAFVHDPDGYNGEAVCHAPEP